MNVRIFTPSTYYKRGLRLATQAGLFYFRKGVFTPTYRRPVFNTEHFGSALPAQVDTLTAVAGGPLFCPQNNVNVSENAHQHNAIRPPARPFGRPDKRRYRAFELRRSQPIFPAAFSPLIC